MSSAQIQTVLGSIAPSALGRTLTHEHIKMDYKCCLQSPWRKSDAKRMTNCEFTLSNLGWIRQNPYSHLFNLAMGDEPFEDMVKELNLFKQEGGQSIVEATTVGISRDVEFLAEIASVTGLNIIAGTGYYLDHTLPPDVKAASVEELSKSMVKELTEGVDGTTIKCGVIGEIGCSWPLTSAERNSLLAAAEAQFKTGAPLLIHPGRNEESPIEIVRILQEAGADIKKTVMSHLDRTVFDQSKLLELASEGIYLEYDLFGIEVSYYQSNVAVDFMNDAQRIQNIKFLASEGYADKIVIAHDVHTRHRLVKYGGHGYAHIQINVIPKMLTRGISQDVIDKIQIFNPQAWLSFK
ncbi:phosphotriesterase-related protein-like [Acropora muricata]|uniref:phosphotriesterase-related protein-like n=1 Tax=Acropora muricata TaxID=159855 RepID=UPI0034E42BF4